MWGKPRPSRSEVLCVSGGHSQECPRHTGVATEGQHQPLSQVAGWASLGAYDHRHLWVRELGGRPVKRSMRMSPSRPWGSRRAVVPPAPRRRGQTPTSDLASHTALTSPCQGRFLPQHPGAASWAYDLCSLTASYTQKGPILSFLLCYCCLEKSKFLSNETETFFFLLLAPHIK